MDHNERSLYYFRNLLYCLYREIRVYRRRNYPNTYYKVNTDSGYFIQSNGLKIAESIYNTTKKEKSIKKITEPYEEKSGLTINDIYEIFSNGNWDYGTGHYSYGGPKWAEIAYATIELMSALQENDIIMQNKIMDMVDTLEHNNGKILNKFFSDN